MTDPVWSVNRINAKTIGRREGIRHSRSVFSTARGRHDCVCVRARVDGVGHRFTRHNDRLFGDKIQKAFADMGVLDLLTPTSMQRWPRTRRLPRISTCAWRTSPTRSRQLFLSEPTVPPRRAVARHNRRCLATSLDRLLNNRRSIGRPFRLVWASVLVSSTGDGMFVTAFPLLAATLTLDPVLIAGVTIASRLPWLVAMISGAIADRTDRRRLMILADLFRLVVVGALGLVIALGVVQLWMLYVCAFLLGMAETLHVNAAQAMLPMIVGDHHLLDANARFASAQTAAAQFVGPPMGSVLFNAAASLPFLSDAASFAGSALLIAQLPADRPVAPPATRLRADVREGFEFIRGHRAMRRMAGVLAIINFFYFAAIALLVLYTSQQLHSGKVVYTALFVGAAAGTVLSRWFVGPLTRRFGLVLTLTIAFWMWALSVAGMAVTGNGLVAIAMFVVLGFGNGLWLTLNTTLRQRLTPNRLLGRMNAAYRTVSWGVVPFGAAFGGVFARLFGLRAPFIAAAVVLTLIAIFAGPLMRPVREADAAQVRH